MKILCVADAKDPLVYSSLIKERFKDVSLVLGAGDLPLKYYGFIVTSLNKPLLHVFGNHNLENFDAVHGKTLYPDFDQGKEPIHRYSFGSIHIGGRVVKAEGILIAGLGGCRNYNNGKNQYSEFQMFLRIVKLMPKLLFNRIFRGRWLDILLTHAPPYQLGDREDPCHKGFKVFRLFLRWFKPKYMLHGHVHLWGLNDEREITYGNTKIINVFNHVVLDYEEQKRGRKKSV